MAGAQIKGNKRPNWHEEATCVQAQQIAAEYDSDEWTSGIVTDEDLALRVGTKLFINVGVYHRILIRSDQTVVLRFNDVQNPTVTIRAGEPFEETRLEITSLFLTTTAASNVLKIYGT